MTVKLLWEKGKQKIDELLERAAREETKLFCGHWLRYDRFLRMYWVGVVRCPVCGLSWKGYQVINTNKSQPKRELREAERMGRMTAREFFKGPGRGRR